MQRVNRSIDWRNEERVLGWTMRIVGFLLAAISLVFLTQDIFHGSSASYFFAISAGLGLITLITSWLPSGVQGH